MDLVEVEKRDSNPITVRHPWELARFEIVNSLLKDVIKNDPNYNVLDIGCGDIFFISKLSSLYPQTNFYAIDIAFTDDIISKLKKVAAGQNIFLFKSLDEANFHLKKPADLVLLLDVVEHIEDDKGFLKSLHDNKGINNDTHVMITVPAYQGLFCSHDHFLGHYRRYTNTTLLNTLNECGFKKEKLGYFFSTLIGPRIIQVIKEKIIKPDLGKETTGLVEWNKGAGFTNFVKNILLFDYNVYKVIKKITGLSLPGLSNYILCKKRVL
ncbi:MAG: class I SAM-dependent methyltransferase [Bacteroidetes bacterium]|nr:class I SAM-dependent methyltransferase [Bacteroidota bacterium]